MRERPMSAFVVQALREAELRRPAAEVSARPLAGEVSVDQLAIAAAEGDAQAVGRLYDALVDPIYRYVVVRVHRREDAEDLTQVVFERIVASLPRYRHRGRPFEAWAFRIARNAVIDHVRRERSHEPLDPESGHLRAEIGPEAISLHIEEIRELNDAIGSLTADQQEAIALRYAAGLSAEEAAQVMGRRAGTIRGLTFRAIVSLRRHMNHEERQEAPRR